MQREHRGCFITTLSRVLALTEDKNAVETQGRWRVVSGSYSTWRTWRVFNYGGIARLGEPAITLHFSISE